MSEPEIPSVESSPSEVESPEDGESPGNGNSSGSGGSSGSGDTTGGAESPNRSLMIVLSYLWILALIPLLTETEDKRVQWHARHGLVLTAAEIVFWLAVFLLNAFSGFLGCLLMPLYIIAWLGILGLHVACMVKGVRGERLIIPGISQYADRF